jgi:hypothetical protein
MTEPTTSEKPKKIQEIDPLLSMFLTSALIDFRKDSDNSVAVTFVVGGDPISGHVVPEGRWIKLFRALLSPTIPNVAVSMDIAADLVEKLSQENRDQNEGYDLKAPQYLSLRDATQYTASGTNQLGLTRVRVTDIAAWWPGILAQA